MREEDMKKIAALALLALAGAAQADTLNVNLAGMATYGFWQNPLNSNTTINLPVGTQITNVEWIDLTFTALGASWRSELVLSVNDSPVGAFWDHSPALGTNSPGVYGPASGVFTNPGNQGGAPFTMTTNSLYIELYETFDDATATGQDASVQSGILRITYTPIPAPASVALMGLGGLVAFRRRRA
jgi:hypothetical protein